VCDVVKATNIQARCWYLILWPLLCKERMWFELYYGTCRLIDTNICLYTA